MSGHTAMAPLAVSVPLLQRLRALAQERGSSLDDLAESLLKEALVQAEARPAGRCSTRLQRCSAGPLPLPYQQP
ncbi:MAG: hypothetical protein VKK98_02480 [Cyanobacteriota bacterium]|nr:hypothetical protein [Cyanobacteriota bacterium]